MPACPKREGAVKLGARARGPLVVALTCTFAVALYATIRAGQVLLSREPDPRVAFFDAHSGFFWRIWISVYGAGLAAPIFVWLVRARGDAIVLVWTWLVPAVAVFALIQAVLLP